MKAIINAWRLRQQRRRNRSDARILGCLLQGDHTYSAIWKRTGLGSGSVYPALARLEAAGLIWSSVSVVDNRRYYFLNYERYEDLERWYGEQRHG